VSPRYPSRSRPAGGAAAWRQDGDRAPVEDRAFYGWLTAPSGFEPWDALARLSDVEQRVLSKGASGGGFMVPVGLADQTVAAARAAGALSQLALEFVTDGGETFNASLASTHGTAAWVAESASVTPSDETITQASLSSFKATTKIIVSEELLTDSGVDLDAYLASELGGRIGALAEAGYINGSGSGQPLGITNAGYTTVTAATGSTTNFTPADLAAAYKALPAAYWSSATWLLNPDLFANLATRLDTANALVFQSLQFSPPSLLGLPVAIAADLPAPAANAKSAAIGDWRRAYAVRRVNGVQLQRQEELHGDAGQVGFRSWLRTDGRPLLTDAARILAHSAT
jgi:HK97 family phage major capsid protein